MGCAGCPQHAQQSITVPRGKAPPKEASSSCWRSWSCEDEVAPSPASWRPSRISRMQRSLLEPSRPGLATSIAGWTHQPPSPPGRRRSWRVSRASASCWAPSHKHGLQWLSRLICATPPRNGGCSPGDKDQQHKNIAVHSNLLGALPIHYTKHQTEQPGH